MDAHRSYRFGDFTLDLKRGALLRSSQAVPLRPKSYGVLRVLLERHGELVTKDELLAAVWGRTIVTDGALTQCVIDVRRALGDDAHEIVRTVPRRGYIFDADVVELPAAAPVSVRDADAAPAAPPVPRTAGYGRAAAMAFLVAAVLLAALAWSDRSPWQRDVRVVDDGVRAFEPDSGGAMRPGEAASGARPTLTPAAHDAFFRGRFFFERRTGGDLERARRAYLEALRIEPRFARAWAGLAGVYRAEIGQPDADVAALMQQWHEAVDAALRIDPRLAEAHMRAAAFYRDTGDKARASREAATAYELAPDDPAVVAWFAEDLAWQGRFDEALAMKRRIVESNPVSRVARVNYASDLLSAGRLGEARTEFGRVLEMDPTSGAEIDVDLTRILVLEGRHAEALARAQRWPSGPDRDFVLVVAYGALHQDDRAAAAVARLRAGVDASHAVRLAEAHAYRREPDEAFRWLQVAHDRLGPGAWFSTGWRWLRELRFSPFLRPLQTDPRWLAAGDRTEQLTVWRGRDP
jgi:DNA-binding winged helix-turn-helix (wHTH) protein/Tfp pilus assembly protein PilF